MYVEKQTEKKIKILRTDNGKEYCNTNFANYLKSHGIHHQLSVEYTPQQNGVAERQNRTLVEMARCLLIDSGLPQNMWAEAVNTANYIRNRCSSRSINGEIPHSLWHNRKPNVKHFQVFGSTAYALQKHGKLDKFQEKSKKYIFTGYCDNAKAYRLWSVEDNKIIKSRDVIFISKEGCNNAQIPVYETFYDKNEKSEKKKEDKVTDIKEETEWSDTLSNKKDNEKQITKRCRGRPRILRSNKKGRPVKLYRTENVEINPCTDSSTDDENTEENEEMGSMALLDPYDIKDIAECENAEEWKNAMSTELKAHIKNKTWTLVPKTKDLNVIGSRWVFTIKYDNDGNVIKRKARLVAKGCLQRPGVDYRETFAPVVRHSSNRLLTALGVYTNRSKTEIKQRY